LTQLRYLHIMRRPGATRLLLPALAARIPDSIAATAITVLVRSVTGSYSLAGFAAGAFGIGTAVSAPLTGRALDRLGQRRILPVLAAAFALALVVLALAAGHVTTAVVCALAVVAGLSRPPIEAALRAMWPRLVPAAEVAAAYALDSTAQELIWIGGPLLLAGLLATGSSRFPLLACAAASAVGTALYVLGLRRVPADRDDGGARGSPLRRGRFRALLVPVACYGVAAGMLNLAFVAFATAHGGVAWAGVLVAIWGVGSLAGGLWYGNRDWRGSVEGQALVCLALLGAVLLLLAAAPDLAVLAVLMIPLGLPLSPWLGSLSASVQRAVPAGAATEAFAWMVAVVTVGMAAGSACGGVIIQAAGSRAGFLAAGGLVLAGAGLGALWLPLRRDP
jgi:predicted MFS family arabinose efflux permease